MNVFYNSILSWCEFFLLQKIQGLKLPPPIAHLTFQQNLRCVQYGFDSGNYVMDNSYTSHRRWWGMVSRILTSCCQFVENILFSSLIYSWHIFGNKLLLKLEPCHFYFLCWKYWLQHLKILCQRKQALKNEEKMWFYESCETLIMNYAKKRELQNAIRL